MKRTYSFTSIFRIMTLVGDSLSAGEFQVEDLSTNDYIYSDRIEYSWGQFLARKNGIHMNNFTRGGMTAKEYNESWADEHDFYNPKYKSQAYIIALGVNDILNLKGELGNIKDIDINNYNNNKDTFAGQYGKIIQKYKAINKDAKFFLVTMPKDCRDSDKDKVDKKAFKELLKQMCELFTNTYLVDLYERLEYTFEMNKQYFMHGHLNPMGYVFTADVIDQLIDEIVANNVDEFKLVGMSDLIKEGL